MAGETKKKATRESYGEALRDFAETYENLDQVKKDEGKKLNVTDEKTIDVKVNDNLTIQKTEFSDSNYSIMCDGYAICEDAMC